MARPSIAETFYRDLLARGDGLFAFLDALPASASPTTEGEWLDFKGGASLTEAELKRKLSRTLAGFATTQGGVLIWGLDCRRDETSGVDRVNAVSYVQNPEGFASRLMQFHHEATEPPVLGFEVTAVPNPADRQQGFVVCYIPESPFKPIRTEFGERQYYIRAGDDTVVPSVALLRSLFIPGSTAGVAIKIYPRHSPEHPLPLSPTYIDYLVVIRNVGQVSSTGVMLALTGPANRYQGEFLRYQDWTYHESAISPHSFSSPRNIYPGESMSAFRFRPRQVLKEMNAMSYSLPPGYEQVFEFRIFGDNQAPLVATTRFTEDDVVHRTARECAMDVFT